MSDNKGNNEFLLSREQSLAWDVLENSKNEVSTLLYGGQAGGGKTYLGCMWQIYRRFKYPGTIGYIGRERLKDLKESTLVTFFDVAKLMNLNNTSHFKYRPNTSSIDFNNGSRIMLLDLFFYPSDPDFNSLGSKEYTDGFIEEGATVSKKAHQILLTRTRYKHDVYKLTRKQLITCNPHPGWIKDDVIIPYHENSLNPIYKFVPATLESNPNKDFVEAYRDTLEKNTSEYDRARLLHGDWFASPKTGGEFYKHYSDDFVSQVFYNESAPLHISFDFNVNPYMTCIVMQVHERSIKIIDEICLKSPLNNTQSICNEFKNKYSRHTGGLYIYGDVSGKQEDTRTEKGFNDYVIIERELSNYFPKLRLPRKNPSVAMRGNFINSIFDNNYQGFSIVVNESCKNMRDDFSFLKEDSDGTKKKEKYKDKYSGISFEKWGHCSDAFDYFICECFKNEYENFQSGGHKSVKFIMGNKVKAKSY